MQFTFLQIEKILLVLVSSPELSESISHLVQTDFSLKSTKESKTPNNPPPQQVIFIFELDISEIDITLAHITSSLNTPMIGLSKYPEKFEQSLPRQISLVLHLPESLEELLPNTWIGSSFLVALKHHINKVCQLNIKTSNIVSIQPYLQRKLRIKS